MPKVAKCNNLWDRMLASAAAQGHSPTSEVCPPHSLQVYSLDPGETTGRCRFDVGTGICEVEQLATPNVVQGYEAIRAELMAHTYDVVVCEDYKIYSWKSDDHKWSTLHTPMLIGAIHVLCHQFNIPLVLQMAVQAKDFVTDNMLESWGVYIPGMKHGRDAQRHALYYSMLGKKPYAGRGANHVSGTV